MIQYTTPTAQLVVEGVDITGCDVWVSWQQGQRELDMLADTVEYDGKDTTITVTLTQLQTAKFHKGKVRVQVNWVTVDNYRDATEQKDVDWYGNLLEHEVSYAD